MDKGYVQVYTGNGKGKTTAALGLALRAAGSGMKVFFAQFLKNRDCGEHAALRRFGDLITIRRYGNGLILGRDIDDNDKEAARNGMREIKAVLERNEFELVILDEINVAVHYGLVSVEDLLRTVDAAPGSVELVLTGRYADERIIERADLVTGMKDVKHYSKRGVEARRGIEC